MDKIIFESTTEKEIFKFLELNKKRKSVNFLNQHDLFQKINLPLFSSALEENNNINLIDGFFISAYLSFKNFRRIPRTRGPTFTRDFLFDKNLSAKKKHFFIGLDESALKQLQDKIPHLKKVYSYNPPFIKEFRFSGNELKKMTTLINKFKADYVWVCVGSPKQNILSQDLFSNTKNIYYFNVGAALDFILGKKKEAPLFVREMGLEWFYRLVTDFKYSRKKVWKSLKGALFLLSGRVKIGVR